MIHISEFHRKYKAPTQVEDGNFRLRKTRTGWIQKADDWDSWNTTLLLHHQQIRRGLQTLQLFPKILPRITYSLKPIREFFSFGHKSPILCAWFFNKSFSTPNFNVLVCLASLNFRNMNLSLTTAPYIPFTFLSHFLLSFLLLIKNLLI